MPFRDVVGHRRLVELLARSVARGTLPPSLIFAGPAGVGKRLAAPSTAQALNCLQHVPARRRPRTVRARPSAVRSTHAARARRARGSPAASIPTSSLVEPGDTGSIKIEQVRDVVDRAAYRPFEGGGASSSSTRRTRSSPAAQNALLKTLEEPPSMSVFMLVTSRPDALLPTVRSRCPRLRFRPLGADEVARC